MTTLPEISSLTLGRNPASASGRLHVPRTFRLARSFRKAAGTLLLLAACASASAQTFLVLTNFSGTNGDSPRGGLAISGSTLYGTTYSGGESNKGTVFKLNTDGSGLTVLKSLSGIEGENPVGSLRLSGSTLYGATFAGGFSNGFYTVPSGTLFKLNTDGSAFGVLRQFNHPGLGLHPNGGMLITNGVIYGTTDAGRWGFGEVYRISTNGSRFRILVGFRGFRGHVPNDTLAWDGKFLFGTTQTGGVNGFGTMFRIRPGASFYVTKDFGGGTAPARYPSAGMDLIGDKLYGTTELGNGPAANSTLFSAKKTTRRYGAGVSILTNLTETTPGFSQLLQSGSTFYGVSSNGGAFGFGKVFKVNSDGTGYTVLHNFDGSDGAYPQGELVVSDGNLYGTTRAGGSAGKGVVFRLSAASEAPQIVIGPKSQSIPAGALVTFSATAAGATPLQYQWRYGGAPISNATNTSYNISIVQSNDAGSYSIVVTNGFGSVTSAVATLTVLDSSAPFITNQPQSVVSLVGSNVLLSVGVSGASTLKYQWYRDDVLLGGATNFTYSISNAQTNDEADFFVVVTNSFGKVTSDVASVSILATGLAITDQPESTTNFVNGTAAFSVAAEGFEPFGYQWWKDGVPVAGQTNDTYEIAGISTNDMGSYRVVVTNSYGSVTSVVATLAVFLSDVPLITSQPQSQSVAPGSTAAFNVSAVGTPPLSYQWWKGAAPVAGKTNASYSISNVQTNNAGNYFVVITNSFGSVTSLVAAITVLSTNLPAITVQPQSVTDYVGANASFNVSATGPGTLQYQWLLNGVPVAGQTGTNYNLSNLQTTNTGGYSVVVTNNNGSVTSVVAFLTVLPLDPPSITLQPEGTTSLPGLPVSLTVSATGPGTLTYQWLFEDVAIPNATNATYSIANVSTNNEGDYSVVVSNPYGSTTSDSATLMVLNVPLEITEQPDSITNQVFSAATFSVTAEGFEPFGYQWWKNTSLLVGETNESVTITGVDPDDAGAYFVVVTNAFGSVTSDVANLIVTLPTPTNYVWINNAGGDWDVPGNWSPNGIPGAADTATIALGVTVSLNDETSVSNLNLTTATLAGEPLRIRGTMNWTNGAVNNALTVKSNAVLNWTSGNLEGSLTVAPGGTLAVTNNVVMSFNGGFGGTATLTNNGTVLWSGNVQSYGGAVIHNAGLWQMLGDYSLNDSGNPSVFLNTGTLQKTAGTGASFIYWRLNTTGTVDTAPSGSWNVSSWTNASLLHGTMNLSGGTMNALITVAGNAVLNWTGGILEGSLTVAPGGTLAVTNNVVMSFNGGSGGTATLTNNGTVLWSGNIQSYGGAVIHNAGLWQMLGDYSLNDSGNPSVFLNTGTLQKTAGASQGSVYWSFSNSGTVKVQSGTLALSSSVVQTAGLTTLNGGNLSVTQPFQLQGGILAGINSVTGSGGVTNTGGVVSPGLSPGQLTVAGNYSQAAGAALQIDLPTNLTGTNSDQLVVIGAAQLAGSLRLALGAGLPITNTFTLLTAAGSRSGVFNNVIYPSNILGIVLSYNPNSVTIQVTNTQSPPSPTNVFNPTINGTNFNVCFAGEPGATYTLEYATNISAPVLWLKLTNVMGSFTTEGCGTGTIQLHDIISAAPERFYRVAYPAY